jgi:hypothetical protein
MKDMPYFMSNKKWYKFDFNKRIFILTDEAPEKANESYEEYIKLLQEQVE